ncbi:MAG: DNA polymerase III [Treponema sp.]|jgi:DNA polymerase-3 subunit gamma/tau|nr:DNA polymerase III [Treponema sp.]
MFETIVGQSAVNQLARDKAAGKLAPALLFVGPPASGKGSAALELARVLSCEQLNAPEDCACASCARHRVLADPDTLLLGSRAFYAEIAASAAAFQRDTAAGRTLFIRSTRKLLARFSSHLWEEDAKFNKISAHLVALEEDIDALNIAKTEAALKKRIDSILKNALKLESEGMSDLIPIAQIRRAAYWSHLAPFGRRKFLLLENADRMQEGARNSLLKLLEEPPASLSIVLTSAREGTLLPTILSRLRPYRFVQRPPELEAQIIQSLFHEASNKGIGAYLDSFLPVSAESLQPLAAFLAASIALKTVRLLQRKGQPLPEELVSLGKISAPVAENAGLGRPDTDAKTVIAKVVDGAGGFELRSLFLRFLSSLLALVSKSATEEPANTPNIGRDIWRKYTGEAANAVGTYNQSPSLALERLMTALPGELVRNFGV